ncbi:MAG: thioredoxin family protein [Bacteroidota bacterium]|nr:thioredoxin family protein [Bacteroidota bacterium]
MKLYITKSITYPEYCSLLEKLLSEGKTTGTNQSEYYLNYAKLNLARMNRLNKTLSLSEKLKTQLQKITKHYIWLVITEGWCGDASQNIPALYLMEKENSNIELRIILRDENLELMDKYLTNGSRSIPKLICLEKVTLNEVFVWGPRPNDLQKISEELSKKSLSKEEKSLQLQKWYNADKTLTLQNEFLELTKLLN